MQTLTTPTTYQIGQKISGENCYLIVTAVKQAEVTPEPIAEKNPIENLKDLAYRAYCGTSFSPEKRAASFVQDYSNDLNELLTQIPDEHQAWVKEKYTNLIKAWLYAKSRCISSMITGPANFPVRRAQKYNQWEQNKYEDFNNWRNNVVKRLNKPEKKTIDVELVETENQIEQLKKMQEIMKEANKVIRDKKLSDEEKIEEMENLGLTEKQAKSILNPDYCGRIGFKGFELTNNNAKIKHYEEKLLKLQKRIDAREEEQQETVKDGVRIVKNIEADRLQLFFDGIPSQEKRNELKKNGFRWSPSNGCWQSYLNSGIWKLKYLSL